MPHRDPERSTLQGSSVQLAAGDGASAMVPALALLWSREEPGRVGEVVCLPRAALDVPFTIGRASEPGPDGALPLTFQQLRPGSRVDTGPLRAGDVSRWQLRVRLFAGDALRVEQIGRGTVCVNGHAVTRAAMAPGDVVELRGRFALLYTRRPVEWPHGEQPGRPFAFGDADEHGLVGESPAAWYLRHQLAFLATRDEHTLVHGPSGAGKELVVRALHAASSRAAAPLVARNAATIPESLVDAELFGNIGDYPNPGTPDRPGLLGEADGGALFLDELGELPHALQARLLRVMDGGEYQRLGEARRRRAAVRLLGATNRDPAALKPDLLARFVHRVLVPGLDERPEDVPLLARHLLRRVAAGPGPLGRFLVGGEPQLASDLVLALVRRRFIAHARELLEVLWQAVAASPGAQLQAPPGLAAPASSPPPDPDDGPEALRREQIVAALAAVGGVREQAWRALGLQSRHQLKRLLKKYNIT